ncbi:hypothetical protein P7K49_023332 [Saguinus oedipus]|uniref:Uncharacterized protein n=1 Tax=Saguinus oedipus TaxID=9490 RepID=A0ABQ9UM14_SAGOE|nr:hypothetical protein P7K49_023332 [Saguinus oedipus]
MPGNISPTAPPAKTLPTSPNNLVTSQDRRLPASPRPGSGIPSSPAAADGAGLTEGAQVAVGLPHHVPVQGPLRGPQAAPLLRGEVYGHVHELQSPRPLAPFPTGFGLSRSPRGEQSRRRRHGTRGTGATAFPVQASAGEAPAGPGLSVAGEARWESESAARGANGDLLLLFRKLLPELG